MNLLKPLKNIYDFEHMLTPFAIEKLRSYHGGNRHVKLIYIFGFRIAYFNITEF